MSFMLFHGWQVVGVRVPFLCAQNPLSPPLIFTKTKFFLGVRKLGSLVSSFCGIIEVRKNILLNLSIKIPHLY